MADGNSKKVSFHTLGCRLNMSETGTIAQGFKDRGYEIVEFGEEADVVFLNTCTVTDGADSTCRNFIRKAKKSSPDASVVVAGCYAQMAPDEIAKIKGVDLILGTSEKYKVFDYLDNKDADLIHIDKTNEFWGAATTGADHHTRAFLKIQDGCNYVCSYCIIPFARGRSRALGIEEVLASAHKLKADGFKEIILTGVNIGEYETQTGEKLSVLLKRLLEEVKPERLRLSSVEPNTITKEILEVLAAYPDGFMDHFHIPLQSGDDEILKQMRRKYDVAQYREVIQLIKSYFPKAGIGADVIVGFPGETQEQFENTYKLMEELPITHFHVFPFSSRKGTLASKMENQIQYAIRKERVKNLSELGERKLKEFIDSFIGTETEVLFEIKNTEGYWEAYTPNYLKVFLLNENENENENNREDAFLRNKILKVKLEEARQDYIFCKRVF